MARRADYDLATIEWSYALAKTVNVNGALLDIWMIAMPPESGPAITVTLPHDRADIIDFITIALRAAQNVHIQLKPGERLDLHERCPWPERAH